MRYLCVALCAWLCTGFALSQTINDNFDDNNLDGWIVRDDTSIANGVVSMVQPGGSIVSTTELPTTGELVCEVDVRFTRVDSGGPQAFLIFAMDDTSDPFAQTNNYYFFAIQQNFEVWEYEIVRRNGSTFEILTDGQLTTDLVVGDWYRMRVSHNNGAISASLTDSQSVALLDINASDTMNPAGAFFALMTDGSGDIDWDNVAVAPGGQVAQPVVQFDATTASGDEGTTAVNLAVSLDMTSNSDVTVDFSATGGSAIIGTDFTLTAGTLTIPAGDTTGNIALTVIDDSDDEQDETVEVTLSNPGNATLGTNTTLTYTITDNDEPVTDCENLGGYFSTWRMSASPPDSEDSNGNGLIDVADMAAAVNNCDACTGTRTVTVSSTAGGSTDRDGANQVDCGGNLTITATPDNGATFTGWSGDASGTNNPLTLSNITVDMTITANFTTSGGDNPPNADAGNNQTVVEGTAVTLDGSGSSDNEGAITYAWTQTAGTNVSLSGANTVMPTFTAPQVESTTTLTFSLEVTDSAQQTDTDSVTITVTDQSAPSTTCSFATLGQPPTGNFTTLTTLEVRNDQSVARPCEVAYSGIPIAMDQNLLDTDNLVIVGPEDQQYAAQFNVLARWRGTVDNTNQPIRWLEVSLVTPVDANSSVSFSLRRYDSAPTASADAFAATINQAGNSYTVDTGVATFSLDATNPAFFTQIDVDTDDDGSGRTTIYTQASGAGPRLVYSVNGNDVDLSTIGGNVTVDNFEVVETGPVKVVVMMRGHFVDPGGTSMCTANNPAYEGYGWSLVATFVRGSRDVVFKFNLRNECSDAFSGPWTDNVVTISRASFDLPFETLGGLTAHYGGAGGISDLANFRSNLTVAQNKGSGTPWVRDARITFNGNDVETGEQFANPFAAISNTSFIIAGQMPWMRYREPQALVFDGNAISFRFISEAQLVGEGKGIWNIAALRIRPTGLAAGDLPSYLSNLRATGMAELERGLLVRAALDFFNASAIFPSIGTNTPSTPLTGYLTTMNTLHDETVNQGGQWDRGFTYGSQLWPDIPFEPFQIDGNTQPSDHNVRYNYWNPSGAEMLEFFRAGDPKWVWDFAMPQSWLQLVTAYLNIGYNSFGNRGGFAVTSGGSGDGQWHRSSFGSDDYNYNAGMQLAYLLRPCPTIRDRIAHAVDTVINRYNLPKEDEGQREIFVNQVDITRQVIQHFEMLANGAEFLPGQEGTNALAKLHEIMGELVNDNLVNGIMCQDDQPSATRCLQPQQFMQNAMFYNFFMRYYRNYGDIDNLLRRALVNIATTFYTYGIAKLGDGINIDINADWAAVINCDLNNGTITDCQAEEIDGFPMFFPTKPHTGAMLLMAHELDPSIGYCGIVQTIFNDATFFTFWEDFMGNQAGWTKGSSQMMQNIIFGLGIYDTCSDP